MAVRYDDLRRRVNETRDWLQRIRRMTIEEGNGSVASTEPIVETPTTDEDEDVGGMTEAEINDKHFRIRGSLDLKYPPRDQACLSPCGFKDVRQLGEPPRDHVCVLGRHHKGECEFSSECAAHDA